MTMRHLGRRNGLGVFRTVQVQEHVCMFSFFYNYIVQHRRPQHARILTSMNVGTQILPL
jgi:hypothetical protein